MIFYLIRENIVSTILFLICLSLVVLMFFKKETELLVIAVDKHGTRILNDSSDETLKEIEHVHFIRKFIDYYFNFNSQSIDHQISKGIRFLSSELWETQEVEKYNKFNRIALKNQIDHQTTLKKIEYLEETSTYKLALESIFNKAGVKKKSNYTLNLKIRPVKRNISNKWGLEIYEIHRIY